ncbi:MAG TPA: cupin domain-containing protein [Bacteroidota bacterium]|nr:cupin domain-containing protein [Bacteroidota bacterium]
MEAVNLKTAEHYKWGEGCDGWHLAKMPGLSVIQEKVPGGRSEVRHFHNVSEQFFYVLSGEATIETGEKRVTLHAGEGLSVPSRTPHQFRNESTRDFDFLVVSAPPSHGDRVTV